MSGLTEYIYGEIVPRYAFFDRAHSEDHARSVIDESMRLLDMMPQWLADHPDCDPIWRQPVDRNVLLAASACHDLGLVNGRENHHIDSGVIIRSDTTLHSFFNQEQIELIAQAAEDHRASSKKLPRSIYGMLVSEADRVIDTDMIILRTLQYGFQNYPDLSREGHVQRAIAHLREKYGKGGYLCLLVPWSDNSQRLSELQTIISDNETLHNKIDMMIDP